MTIGRRLDQIMVARGISNAALSSRVGVRPQAVAAWRRDVQDPEIARLSAIARALGVHQSDLLMPAEVECPRVPPESTLFLREISEEMRSWLKVSGKRLWMARVTLCGDLTELVVTCKCPSVGLWRDYEDGLHFPDPLVIGCFCEHTNVTLDFLYRGILSGLPDSHIRKLTMAYPELIQKQDSARED